MITVTRIDDSGSLHSIHIREHSLLTDMGTASGGDDAAPDPHDFYDSALGACKALTLVWYARRKSIPLEACEVVVSRDATREREGVYRLRTALSLGGDLSEAQREELLDVAARCPVHKLMTDVTTEIDTVLAVIA